MARSETTSAIIDGVLRFAVTGSALATGLMIPNLLIGLEKPLNIFWKHMDKRQRDRELRRIVSYMKSKNLLRGDYEHGLQITEKGRKRLSQLDFDSMIIKPQPKWDHTWRLVIYDIPEEHKAGRKALISKFNKLKFHQLQRSAWLHPFPCRDVVETITSRFKVDIYVSYIETAYIDNQSILTRKFKSTYPKTSFK